MKATGLVRAVDNLGRVVIPKELRKTMHIEPGDPMEIFVDGENIVLKKYPVDLEIGELLDRLEVDLHRVEYLSPAMTDKLVEHVREMRRTAGV